MIDIDDVNSGASELDTVIDSLINYLEERMSDTIDKFYPEWPEANMGEYQNVLSVHTVNASHRHTMRTLLSAQDVLNDDIKTAALYRVGDYEMELQVDIWCAYKSQRNKIYSKFYDIINEELMTKDNAPAGLSLKLENYYGVIARYDISGYNFPDDERSSQEDEWRVKIDLKVHFDKVVEIALNKIKETIIVDTDPDTGEETISENIVI